MNNDPFSTRYGYIAGKCNAYRHTTGHIHKTEGLCRRWPRTGSKRCSLHGGGWHETGGNTIKKKPKKEKKKRIFKIKRKFNEAARKPKPVKVPKPKKIKSPYKSYSELFAWKKRNGR